MPLVCHSTMTTEFIKLLSPLLLLHEHLRLQSSCLVLVGYSSDVALVVQ